VFEGNEDNELVFDFTIRSAKFDIFMQLERLVGSQRIESHKHLLDWVLKKWRRVAGNYEGSKHGPTSPIVGQDKMEAESSDNICKLSSDPEVERKRLAAERSKKNHGANGQSTEELYEGKCKVI
jgi:hypothetical protein